MRAPARPGSLLLSFLTALALVLGPGSSAASAASGAAADTARGPADASWTGYAFDACRAPSQRVMDRWLTSSPFLGVGVYIGGSMRACRQPHLTRRWVSRQARAGWRLLPIWVGPQASCSFYRSRISSAPGARGLFPTARRQGEAAALGAAAAARSLGIGRGGTLWYDLEAFSIRGYRCRASALRFLSGWTTGLHRRGYRSGVYSSVSAAIDALHGARSRGAGAYVGPDHIWFAWANHRANSAIGRGWVRSAAWMRHRRVHQYTLDQSARYGGIRLRIDRNFVDLRRPAAARRAARKARGACGHLAERRGYPLLRRGSAGPAVAALKCLLAEHRLSHTGAGRVYGGETRAAVRRFQRARHLRVSGRTDARTWTALLATGSGAVLKRGSAGLAVRRLQRALNAALPRRVAVTGHFGAGTASAVRRYQRVTGRAATGVVAPSTWSALKHGLLPRAHHRSVRKARRHRRHGVRPAAAGR